MLLSDQLAQDFPGETGLFISSVVGAMGCQARELGATSPSHQERLATEEADRAAAYLLALEQEVTQPGGNWELSDDANGGFGHPAQPDDYDSAMDGHDDVAQRFWLGPPDDDTYMN